MILNFWGSSDAQSVIYGHQPTPSDIGMHKILPSAIPERIRQSAGQDPSQCGHLGPLAVAIGKP